jgi:hypothetical protein
MKTRVTSRNTALQNLGDELDNGFVAFYDGTRPSDPDAALSGNALIVTCALPIPACSSPAGATRAFNTILDSVVVATGTPTFARFFLSDGTTGVVDMQVPEEITLSKSDWTAGEPFVGPSVTFSLPVGE